MASNWLDKLGDYLFTLRDRLHRARGGKGNVDIDQIKGQVTDALTPKMPEADDNPDQAQARRVINKNPVLVGLACVVLVILFVAIGAWMMRPAKTVGGADVWYYDLASGAVTSGPREATMLTAGRVIAHRYACDSCDSNPQYVGYLQTISTDPAHRQAALDAAKESDAEGAITELPDQVHVITRENLEGGWVPLESPEGEAILNDAVKPCPNSTAKLCLP